MKAQPTVLPPSHFSLKVVPVTAVRILFWVLYADVIGFLCLMAVLPFVLLAEQLILKTPPNVLATVSDIIYFPLQFLPSVDSLGISDVLLMLGTWTIVLALAIWLYENLSSSSGKKPYRLFREMHGPYFFAYVTLFCLMLYLPGSDNVDLFSNYVTLVSLCILGYLAYWTARTLEWLRRDFHL